MTNVLVNPATTYPFGIGLCGVLCSALVGAQLENEDAATR